MMRSLCYKERLKLREKKEEKKKKYQDQKMNFYYPIGRYAMDGTP